MFWALIICFICRNIISKSADLQKFEISLTSISFYCVFSAIGFTPFFCSFSKCNLFTLANYFTPLNRMDESNPSVILFTFARMSRYILQTCEKKSHVSPIQCQSKKIPVLPRTTIAIFLLIII